MRWSKVIGVALLVGLAAGVSATLLISSSDNAFAQMPPGQRPFPGGRPPGGGPGGPGGPARGNPDAPAASAVAWTDVQVHLRAGGRDFDSVISQALDKTAPLGRKMLVLVPPPFPSETANANAHDYEAFLPSVSRNPDKLAFLGGAKLNATLQSTDPARVTPEIRARFLDQARRTLDSGARGFGELALLHLSEFDGHPYERIAPDHPLLLELADLAASRNAVIAVHMEAVERDMDLPPMLASPPNPRRLAENIAAFERLLSRNAASRIVWLHAGWDNTGQRTPELTRRLMARHANLSLALKFRPSHFPANAVAGPAGPNASWMAVIRDHPDRVMIGTDSFFAGSASRAGGIFEPQPVLAWLSRLPPPLAQRIGSQNAERLYNLGGR